jgi:BirA family transcriptional regulator, biotin operon repressor / biotin---[acetyl-CoA-carboxylase] ligase
MIHFKIRHTAEVSSTSTVAMEAARQGAPEGLVITADHQTAGRGKPGRQWLSPPGKNLLCSVLLRPPLTPAQAPMLTQIACRAVAKVLKEKYDIVSEFKRPNDVMVNSKKICGTLVESFSTQSRLEAVVVGIGLNVNAEAAELPPEGVSIKLLTGIEYPIDDILGHLLDELGHKCGELYKNTMI